MAKRLTTEDHLATLRRLRESADRAQVVGELRELLGRANLHGIVVKGAADLARKVEASDLAPLLVQQARGLMGNDSQKRDPGCEAKTAMVQALIEWEFEAGDFYVELARFHQHAPTFGGSVDVAAECRGLAAIGLVRSSPEGAINILVDLLADEEKATRVNAALAIGMWPGPEVEAVLRLKARMGDESAEVLGEVFAGLLRISARNVALVATQLVGVDARDPTKLPAAEAAALALGQSKIPEALAVLTEAWPAFRGSAIASSVLLAIGLHRSEGAIDWLVGQISKCRTSEAGLVIDALAPYRTDEKVRARVEKVVRGNVELLKVFEDVFK